MNRDSTKMIGEARKGTSPESLEILREGRVGSDVQEDGSLGEEVGGSRGLGIEIRGEPFGEDVKWSENLVTVGLTHVAILD